MSKSGKKTKKLVRDSFTMPAEEHQIIDKLKKKIRTTGSEVKKSELIRAGIAVLDTLSSRALAAAINRVPNLKTGRPAKDISSEAEASTQTETKTVTAPEVTSKAARVSRRSSAKQSPTPPIKTQSRASRKATAKPIRSEA
jgi:FixJ family two-component response regulator